MKEVIEKGKEYHIMYSRGAYRKAKVLAIYKKGKDVKIKWRLGNWFSSIHVLSTAEEFNSYMIGDEIDSVAL